MSARYVDPNKTGRWDPKFPVVLRQKNGGAIATYESSRAQVSEPLDAGERGIFDTKLRILRSIYAEDEHFAILDRYLLSGKTAGKVPMSALLISGDKGVKLGWYQFRSGNGLMRDLVEAPLWSADRSTAAICLWAGPSRASLLGDEIILFKNGQARSLVSKKALGHRGVDGFGLHMVLSKSGGYLAFFNVLSRKNADGSNSYELVRMNTSTGEIKTFPGLLLPASVSESGEVQVHSGFSTAPLK